MSDAPKPLHPADVLKDVLREVRMANRDLAPSADGKVPDAAVTKARECLARIITEHGGAYFYT